MMAPAIILFLLFAKPEMIIRESEDTHIGL
jgi:hypothetical protein